MIFPLTGSQRSKEVAWSLPERARKRSTFEATEIKREREREEGNEMSPGRVLILLLILDCLLVSLAG